MSSESLDTNRAQTSYVVTITYEYTIIALHCLLSEPGLLQQQDSLSTIQCQLSRPLQGARYLVGEIVYPFLCYKEDSGREYALQELTSRAAIQSMESFLLENGKKSMERSFVTLGVCISRLQSTLDNASEGGTSTRQSYRKRVFPTYM